MSERLKYVVTFNDGRRVEGESRTSDIIAFERRFQLPGFLLGDQDHIRIEHMVFMGYRAITRDWPDKPDFDDWIETVDSVDMIAPEGTGGDSDKPPLDPTA